MFIWLSDRSKNHSLPHHPHGADKEGGQHRGIIYAVSEGWDGDSHKGHCGVKEIVEAYSTSEQDVLFSTYWHLRTEKGKNSLFFTSWLKKPTANQMACIAFFTFGEKMKSLSIWYLHTCQFVSESNTFDFWFHVYMYYMMSILNLWSENISLSSTVKFEVFERVSWINGFYPQVLHLSRIVLNQATSLVVTLNDCFTTFS